MTKYLLTGQLWMVIKDATPWERKTKKYILKRVCLILFFFFPFKKVLFIFRNNDASDARRMSWSERFVGVRHGKPWLLLYVPPTPRRKRATLGCTRQMHQHLLIDTNYYLFLFLEELKAEYMFHRTIIRVSTKRTRVEYKIASVRLDSKIVKANLSC